MPSSCGSSNEAYVKKNKAKRRAKYQVKKTLVKRLWEYQTKKSKPPSYDYAKSLGFSEFLAMNMHLYGDGSFFCPKEDQSFIFVMNKLLDACALQDQLEIFSLFVKRVQTLPFHKVRPTLVICLFVFAWDQTLPILGKTFPI